jgi:hypothetical protein
MREHDLRHLARDDEQMLGYARIAQNRRDRNVPPRDAFARAQRCFESPAPSTTRGVERITRRCPMLGRP